LGVTNTAPLPRPVKVTESGLPEVPVNGMLREPLRVPAPPGVKFIKMEQLPPFAAKTKAGVQPLNEKVKSAELVPPIVTEPMVTATFEPFVTMI